MPEHIGYDIRSVCNRPFVTQEKYIEHLLNSLERHKPAVKPKGPVNHVQKKVRAKEHSVHCTEQ